jgi:hypothetical protein
MADGAGIVETWGAPARVKRGAGSVRRPTDTPYSEEVAANVCIRISTGETLTAICESPDAPSWATWYKWLDTKPGLADAYARARVLSTHASLDDMQAIVKSALRGEVDVAAARVALDEVKWRNAKLNPREFGDNLQVRHADANGDKLNTQPLVAELLATLAPGSQPTAPIDVTPRVVTRVKEAPQSDTRMATDVSDLV